jgi:hypothetical protein
MALALQIGGARAADPRDQDPMDHVSDDEEHRPGQDSGEIGSNHIAEDRGYAQRSEDIERRIHAEHHEVALREVDDAHHSEDEGKADAHQPIDRADQETGCERLKNVFRPDDPGHGLVLPLTWDLGAVDHDGLIESRFMTVPLFLASL